MLLFGLPRKAGLFWLLVVAAAAGVLCLAWTSAPPELGQLPAALFFTLACGVAECIQVRLNSSRPGGAVLYSLSCAVLVAVVLLFPFAWAALIAAAGLALGGLLRGQRDAHKLIFNSANLVLSVSAAGCLWGLTGRAAGLQAVTSIPWMLLAAVVFFLINTSLTAAIVAFVLELPITLVWRRSHDRMLMANLALLMLGIPIAGLWLAFPWMLACLAVALLALHRAMADRVKLETQTLDSLFELADILDARDPYTHGHSERVGYYAEQVALQLGLSSDRAHLAFLAGRLHDIGKCAINNEVLLKPGALDDGERHHMRRHPEVGSAMLEHFSLFGDVARSVRGHHERWDGTGYPDGLRGEAIPLESRVIAVVDSYDAMTTTRPYRTALPHAEAVRRLRQGAGRQWDPRVVASFIAWAEQQHQGGPQADVAAAACAGSNPHPPAPSPDLRGRGS